MQRHQQPRQHTEAQAATATAAVSSSLRSPRKAAAAASDPHSPIASAFTASAADWPRFRGPNGSGKSSLLRLLAGLLPMAEGSLSWRGHDVLKDRAAYRADIAYLGHLDAQVIVGRSIAQHLRGAFDRCKRSAYLMRQTGGELPDRREPFRVLPTLYVFL